MNSIEKTKTYYDSSDADDFYRVVWGGEDIHVGIYKSDTEPIKEASRRTVELMASKLNITNNTRILDIGAGYGGAARYLAATYECHITCLNLSKVENDYNREKNKEVMLEPHIKVVEGNFEQLPFDDESFDIVWSEDAILHSPEKATVFAETARVLKKGGDFIFTDPMQQDIVPEGVLEPILNRIHLDHLGSVAQYKRYAKENNLQEATIMELPAQLTTHYSRVLQELTTRYDELKNHIDQTYLDNMMKGLKHWIDGGKNNYLNWGILHFRK